MMEHLKEFRNRLFIVVGVWLVASSAAFFFAELLYVILTQPLHDIFEHDENRRLIYTSLTEPFLVYIKLSLLTGLLVSFPLVAQQLYRFVAPGLYKYEKRVFAPFLIVAPLLFFAGFAFAYMVVIPLAWAFFVGFEQPASAAQLPLILEAKISEYVGLSLQLMLAFGLAFQLPVILSLLMLADLVSVESLSRNRRYAVIGMLVFAAIITPPDVISQLMLFIPLYLLYEGAIIFGKIIKTRKKEMRHA